MVFDPPHHVGATGIHTEMISMATKKNTVGVADLGRIPLSIRNLPSQVRETVETLQKDGGKVLSRIGREAATIVTQDPRRNLEVLVDRAKTLRKDLRKRADRAVQQVESRGQKLIKRIEKGAESSLDPVLRRLRIASRSELETLRKRVHGLEQRVAELGTKRSA
jgi:polyhydroxyalkanoate synthesis regulator phasin